MVFNNIEIRQEISNRRLKYYEVADALGIHAESLSRMLRKELSEKDKKKVLDAIKSIK